MFYIYIFSKIATCEIHVKRFTYISQHLHKKFTWKNTSEIHCKTTFLWNLYKTQEIRVIFPCSVQGHNDQHMILLLQSIMFQPCISKQSPLTYRATSSKSRSLCSIHPGRPSDSWRPGRTPRLLVNSASHSAAWAPSAPTNSQKTSHYLSQYLC